MNYKEFAELTDSLYKIQSVSSPEFSYKIGDSAFGMVDKVISKLHLTHPRLSIKYGDEVSRHQRKGWTLITG